MGASHQTSVYILSRSNTANATNFMQILYRFIAYTCPKENMAIISDHTDKGNSNKI